MLKCQKNLKHLIITTATIPKEICFEKIGYTYDQRMLEYIKSFEYVQALKEKFNTISIIETISKNKVLELEKSKIKVYYSKFNNSFNNKGLNEMFHIYDFLQNHQINNNDLIIKLTGKYLIINDNILNIKSDFIIKDDGDIYNSKGVHTFFFGFKKMLFYDFIVYLNDKKDNMNHPNDCIEHIVKNFALNKNIKILNNSYKLGVITCIYKKETNTWIKVLT